MRFVVLRAGNLRREAAVRCRFNHADGRGIPAHQHSSRTERRRRACRTAEGQIEVHPCCAGIGTCRGRDGLDANELECEPLVVDLFRCFIGVGINRGLRHLNGLGRGFADTQGKAEAGTGVVVNTDGRASLLIK